MGKRHVFSLRVCTDKSETNLIPSFFGVGNGVISLRAVAQTVFFDSLLMGVEELLFAAQTFFLTNLVLGSTANPKLALQA
jgi:hypothetical protein